MNLVRPMTRLLIISFSDLNSDARLQRQIAAFADRYEVVTAGWGTPPPGVHEHVVLPQAPTGARRKWRMRIEALLLRLHAYRLLHLTSPLFRGARRALRGVTADIVFANDIDAAPLAYGIVPSERVHVDLHEYFPGLHDDNPRWAALRGPFNSWLVREFAAPAASTTTVAPEIAERYRDLGLEPQVVTNASPYQERPVRPVGSPIRLVHSGAALAGRHLDTMIDGVRHSTADIEFTMHLMPNDLGYIQQLRARAADSPNIHILDPVPHAQLSEVLAQHDIGIHILPATSTNHRLALPNKFFDFVQARLGVVVGPTAAMAGMTRKHGFGAVTEDFTAEALTKVLDSLDPATVMTWKDAAAAAAAELSSEHQIGIWVGAIAALDESRSH